MGRVSHVKLTSTSDIMELLGLRDFARFQVEFQALLRSDTSLLVEDWSSEPELLEVFYAWTRLKRPHTSVEIGTYKGKCSIVLATALEANAYGHIYTIDNNQSGAVPEAKARFSASSVAERITLLEQSSQSAFDDWVRAKIDVLFVDGSHEYLDTCADLGLWCRHLADDGMIAVHDTQSRLQRRFPEDYLFPLEFYDVINVTSLTDRPSGHEWEGCAFIRFS